jgi:hypothetical protein
MMTGEHRIKKIDISTQIGQDIGSFLDEIDVKARCDKCGGLPYDVVFSRSNMNYKFCLYKIERDGEILAETDYERLYEYTRKDGVMMSLRKKHIKK